MARHQCAAYSVVNGKPSWTICTACEGRIHLAGCTTKRNKHRDCCRERHEMLHAAGQTHGIADASIPMLANLDCLDL